MSGWGYRQRGSVNSSAECGDLTDYQIRLVVHRGVGESSGEDVYLSYQGEEDFSDIRFAEVGKPGLLDYWVEEYTAGENATVWVEFEDISTAGTGFYIYYGNDSAGSESDGEATWDFFDDFPGDAVNSSKWDEVNSPAGTVADGELTIFMSYQDSGICRGYSTNDSFGSCRMVARGKTGYSQGGASAILMAQYNGFKCANKVEFRNNNDIELRGEMRDCGGDLTTNITNGDFATGTYYTYYYARQGDEHLRAWQDGEYVGEVTSDVRNASDPGAVLISFFSPNWKTQDLVVDWFGVGQYCAPEPEWGDWYFTEPTPTPTPSATPTATATGTASATATATATASSTPTATATGTASATATATATASSTQASTMPWRWPLPLPTPNP